MNSAFVEFEPDGSRRITDPTLGVIVHKVTRMATDMDKLANSVERMSESVQRLALAEERIGQVIASIERLNKRLDDGSEKFEAYEARIQRVELANVTHAKSDQWIDRAVWGAAAAAVMYIAKKAGLL